MAPNYRMWPHHVGARPRPAGHAGGTYSIRRRVCQGQFVAFDILTPCRASCCLSIPITALVSGEKRGTTPGRRAAQTIQIPPSQSGILLLKPAIIVMELEPGRRVLIVEVASAGGMLDHSDLPEDGP